MVGVDEDEPVGDGRREGEGDRESWWVWTRTSRWVMGGGRGRVIESHGGCARRAGGWGEVGKQGD